MCSPNGSPVCSPCAPTCVTGVNKEQRRYPSQFSKQNEGEILLSFLQIELIPDSGPAAGSPCIFPFKWAGVTFVFINNISNSFVQVGCRT